MKGKESGEYQRHGINVVTADFVTIKMLRDLTAARRTPTTRLMLYGIHINSATHTSVLFVLTYNSFGSTQAYCSRRRYR